MRKMVDNLGDIKKNLKTDKLVLGTERTVKLMKQGKLSKIFACANTEKSSFEDLENYSKLASVQLVKLEVPNDELGIICKKPFPISVIGLKK